MKKLSVILILIVLTASLSEAQTNILYGNIGDYGRNGISGVNVTLTLISPQPRQVGNMLIRVDPIATTSSTNGYFAFTNIIWGIYQLDIAGAVGTANRLFVEQNTLGLWPIGALVNNKAAIPPNPGTNYYTQAQVDALLTAIGANTNAGTNLLASQVAQLNAAVTNNQPAVAFGSLNLTNLTMTGVTYPLVDFNAEARFTSLSNWNGSFAADVFGNVTGTIFTGSGAGLTGLSSNNLSGQINLSQINPQPSTGGGLNASQSNIVNSAITTNMPQSMTNTMSGVTPGFTASALTAPSSVMLPNRGLPILAYDTWPGAGTFATLASCSNAALGLARSGLAPRYNRFIVNEGWCIGHTNVAGVTLPLVHTNFPSPTEPGGVGMKALAATLATNGFTLGLYTEPAVTEHSYGIGSAGYEFTDFNYYTNWGVSTIQLDGPLNSYESERLCLLAAQNSGANLFIISAASQSPPQITTNGTPYWTWIAPAINAYKLPSIGDPITWANTLSCWRVATNSFQYTKRGLVPDFNDIWGNANACEIYSQFAMRCMASADITLGDGGNRSPSSPSSVWVYGNDNLLAIDQDAAVNGPWLGLSTNNCEVWVKPLGTAGRGQKYEVAFWNLNDTNMTSVTVPLATLGIPYSVVTLYDTYSGSICGFATNTITVTNTPLGQNNSLTNLMAHMTTMLGVAPGLATQYRLGTNYLTDYSPLNQADNFASYGSIQGFNTAVWNYNTAVAAVTNGMNVGGVSCTNRMISSYGNSLLRYWLGGQATTFSATLSMTDGSGNTGNEMFWFYTNNVLFASNSIPDPHGGTAVSSNVTYSVAGASTLQIVITSTNAPGAGSDYSVLLNPLIYCPSENIASASPAYMTTIYDASSSSSSTNVAAAASVYAPLNLADNGYGSALSTPSMAGIGPVRVFQVNSTQGFTFTVPSAPFRSAGLTNWTFEIDALTLVTNQIQMDFTVWLLTNNPAANGSVGQRALFSTSMTSVPTGTNVVSFTMQTNLPLATVTNCVSITFSPLPTGPTLYFLPSSGVYAH